MNTNTSSKPIHLFHPFKDKITDVDALFNVKNGEPTVKTVDSFCNRVLDLAKKHFPLDQKEADKFKGDAFEIFVEFFIKNGEGDNRIGIENYQLVDAEEDYGVDGYGTMKDGETMKDHPATVQAKFRTGDYIFRNDEDHLTNFLALSQNEFGVRMQDTKNMLLVTTGLKVDERVMERMLHNKVRVLNREDLRSMLDNFPQWWVAFYNAVKASVTPKQEAFEVKVLRPHQLEAVEACMAIYNDPLDSFKSGKVILPTGTGKTLIESENIRRVILIQQQAGKLPVIKVNSSRILLCGQLCKDIFEYLQSHGVEARYVIFNSGTSDEKWFVTKMKELGGTWRKIICTTDPHEVMDAFQKATTENIPLIIVSTYDSSVKFAESMLCPCLTIHDEAHNLVSGETCKAADRTICPTEASFFFTATEKTTESNEDLGMNNLVRFGKTIYTKAPKEMIEKGEMVPPRTHIVSPKNGIAYDLAKIDNDIEALCISIWDAYAEHEKKIKESSCSPDSIGAKILIVCRGQKELKDMMDPEAEAAAEEGIKTTKKVFKNSVFDTLRKAHPGVHLFALSSDYGIYNDGEFLPSPVSNAKKYALMQKIEALESEESALIFHVDMISEGIDVPGITGVMPFRNCEFAKFMQNVGRSARLHNEDRSNVYAGEIQSNEQDRESKKWVKPFCWVIIPSFLENSSGFEDRYKMIIKDLRENYNFSPCQPTHIDNNEDNGLNDDPDVITVNDKNKKSPHSKSGLEEFEHKFEGMSVCARVEAMAANSDEKDDFLDQLITLGNTCPTRTIVPIVDAVLPPTERSTPRLAKGSVKPQKRPIDLTADLTGIIYRMDERGIVATGKIVNGKFIILPGSGFRYEANPSMPVGYGEIRNRMIQEGIVVNGIVVREFEVSSGSTAAGVLLGASANGNACWNRI